MRCIIVLGVFLLINVMVKANPYLDNDLLGVPEDELSYPEVENYVDELEAPAEKRSFSNIYRRSCIRRSGNCDHRPNGCCSNGSCRCNLWGANCRCQRMGLFSKFGK